MIQDDVSDVERWFQRDEELEIEEAVIVIDGGF